MENVARGWHLPIKTCSSSSSSSSRGVPFHVFGLCESNFAEILKFLKFLKLEKKAQFSSRRLFFMKLSWKFQ